MPDITGVTFTAACRADQERGLIGWIGVTIDGGLRLDGIALRSTRSGGLTLSFPSRTDRRGNRHFTIRPVDDRSRRDFERSVLAALAEEIGE